MTTVAIIPARAGSKSIPKKNTQTIGGYSLTARAVASACQTSEIDNVYVSTDSADVAREAQLAGAKVIERPTDLATDTSTSEDALLHACAQLTQTDMAEPEIVVFIQATSPFIQPASLGEAIVRVRSGEADVLFSAVESHAFLWRVDGGSCSGVNHDSGRLRQRRQDRPIEYKETGAFYVMRYAGFVESRTRFFGKVLPHLVDDITQIEIDDQEDLELARIIDIHRRSSSNKQGSYAASIPPGVRAIVTDFDGVHTDDSVLVQEDGTESVNVSRADGLGVEKVLQRGLKFLILSKERNPVVRARAAKLGVESISSEDDKARALREWCRQTNISPSEVVYVGNDINDLEPMRLVGFSFAVSDARPEVIREASRVLSKGGGDGAVREACELVLKVVDKSDAAKENLDPVAFQKAAR